MSPAASSLSETVNTLRYAARAKKIRTQPFIIMDPREAMILNLKKRVDTLTNENTQLRNLLKKDDSNQINGTTSIVPAPLPIAPIRSNSRKISAKSNSDYDIQDDLGDTQSIR